MIVAAISAGGLLACSTMLRSVRDEMGIRVGIDRLPWLFSATFLVMLAATPLFGWASSVLSRRALLITLYSFFSANLLLFWVFLQSAFAPAMVAKVFFVWSSVFNLFVISLFWSLLADVFSTKEAKARYGYIAAGASIGAIIGPGISAFASTSIGVENILLVAAGALCAALIGAVWISHGAKSGSAETQPLGGGVFDGVKLVVSSKFLLALSGYFILFTIVATFFYLEQARIAKAHFQTSEARLAFLATIDLVTNITTVSFQLIATRILLTKLGSLRSLLTLPVVSLAGLALLAPGGTPLIVGGIQVMRRATDYAFARPARETLFTMVDRESRYKAKNFIDTVVYRGGDMVGAWIDAKLVGAGRLTLAGVGIPLVLVWIGWVVYMNRFRSTVERPADRGEIANDGPVPPHGRSG